MTLPPKEPELMRISWGPQNPMSGQTRIILDPDGEKVTGITTFFINQEIFLSRKLFSSINALLPQWPLRLIVYH